jgi:hypothetical protein
MNYSGKVVKMTNMHDRPPPPPASADATTLTAHLCTVTPSFWGGGGWGGPPSYIDKTLTRRLIPCLNPCARV